MKIAIKDTRGDIYPFLFKFHGLGKILFWSYGKGKGKDHFLRKDDGQIAIAKTSVDVRKIFGSSNDAIIHWDEIAVLDMDWFLRNVRGIRPSRCSTTRVCREMIFAWNSLEDFAYTLGIPRNLRIFRSKVLAKMYDKMFRGNNLPSVTPEGRSYSPIWTKSEIQEFRPAIRELWRKIVHAAPEIVSQ